MPNNVPRVYHQTMVHFLRKTVDYTTNNVAQTIGVIPAGSLILKSASGIHVTVAFNFGTNKLMDIGTSATDNLFGTSLSLATTDFVPLDEQIGGFLVAADTTITATVKGTGTAATAGSGEVVICYIPDTDG